MSSKADVDTRPEKNPSGIPRAPFITDVEEHIGGPLGEVEPVLGRFQDALAKYRYMENNLTSRKASLEEKIPDIKKTLSMVEFLKERSESKNGNDKNEEEDELEDSESETSKAKTIRTTFELNETLYAEADIDESDGVYLWLGANVMLSYSIPEAIDLLRSKLEVAELNLSTMITDLEYLKEQTTIMEVNIARVFNYDIKRRRLQRESEGNSRSQTG